MHVLCVLCALCVCVCMHVNVPATLNFIFLVMEGSVDGFLTHMTAHRREQFLQWVENLPDNQTPAWLGLPNNAEKVLLTNKGKEY